MQNHNDDTIKTSGLSSLEKYTSHFIERVVCERELETERKLQHIDQLFWLSQPLFPVLLNCSTGAWGPSLCWDMVLFPASLAPTLWTSCRRGYIIILTLTYFLQASQFALNSTPRQSRSPPDIFDRIHRLFTLVHFFFWQLCWGQYVTNHHHGYPWPSLTTFPYRSSPQSGLHHNILYPHIVAECMFVLVVLLLHGHVWGSIRVHHLWVRPCFSSSVLHVWFV